MPPRSRNRIDRVVRAVDTAVNIVKLSDATVNPIPPALKLSSPLIELELKALTGDLG
jgi:hypothetical protein